MLINLGKNRVFFNPAVFHTVKTKLVYSLDPNQQQYLLPFFISWRLKKDTYPHDVMYLLTSLPINFSQIGQLSAKT